MQRKRKTKGPTRWRPPASRRAASNLRGLHDLLKDDKRPSSSKKTPDTPANRSSSSLKDMRSQVGAGRTRARYRFERRGTVATPSRRPICRGSSSSTRFSTKNRRGSGTAPQDQVRDNNEGVRFQPPPEWRGKMEGYKNKLAKLVVPDSSAKPAAPRPASSDYGWKLGNSTAERGCVRFTRETCESLPCRSRLRYRAAIWWGLTPGNCRITSPMS